MDAKKLEGFQLNDLFSLKRTAIRCNSYCLCSGRYSIVFLSLYICILLLAQKCSIGSFIDATFFAQLLCCLNAKSWRWTPPTTSTLCPYFMCTLTYNTLWMFQIIPLESFKAQSWNGSFVAVVAGGDGIPLTFSNRNHYVDLALEFRLHEMDKQVCSYFVSTLIFFMTRKNIAAIEVNQHCATPVKAFMIMSIAVADNFSLIFPP